MARDIRTPKTQSRLSRRLDKFLARLDHRDVSVAPLDETSGRLAFWRSVPDGFKRIGAADATLFGMCLERGLVEQGPDGHWRMASAGRAWRRRHASPADPFLAQHAALETEQVEIAGARHQVMFNAAESPLAWLYRRKGGNGARLVSAEQFAAGERLRADYTRAHLMPSITSRWDAGLGRDKQRKGPPGSQLVDSAIAARQRVEQAIVSVGPELSGVLVDVCCFLKGLEDVERANAWPARSAKLVLSLGLTRLARHYGLMAPADTRRSKLRHWGSDDFRPEIQS